MKAPLFTLLFAATCLTGCGQKAEEALGLSGASSDGRYLGIGVYDASPLWPSLAAEPGPAGQKLAKLTDDSRIIVVVDTQTGEVRQCGDLSGHCTSMNPWTEVIAEPNKLPALLTKNSEDLEAEAEAAAKAERARNPN